LKSFGLESDRKTLLVVGGSLGAKSINLAIDKHLDELLAAGLQIIWQTGKLYVDEAAARTTSKNGVWTNAFITEMEKAYAAADIVVSRSGAMSVAEMCVAGKAVIFVPYPFAAEDHQTVNAMQLVNKNAALIIKDSDAGASLASMVIALSKDDKRLNELENNIRALAIRDADSRIAQEIISVLKG
jgi:UDP-N-acetylglucosamine--N-acetylmuramyl-(pentapeptide) pyrophosphoryl-undecaprenol N-acetylglucosamine transferase